MSLSAHYIVSYMTMESLNELCHASDTDPLHIAAE